MRVEGRSERGGIISMESRNRGRNIGKIVWKGRYTRENSR
jgi:hypothetical protein